MKKFSDWIGKKETDITDWVELVWENRNSKDLNQARLMIAHILSIGMCWFMQLIFMLIAIDTYPVAWISILYIGALALSMFICIEKLDKIIFVIKKKIVTGDCKYCEFGKRCKNADYVWGQYDF